MKRKRKQHKTPTHSYNHKKFPVEFHLTEYNCCWCFYIFKIINNTTDSGVNIEWNEKMGKTENNFVPFLKGFLLLFFMNI